jgi:hypothetical protein
MTRPSFDLATIGTAFLACMAMIGCAADRVSGLKNTSPDSRLSTAHALQAGAHETSCKFHVKSINDRREHTSLGMMWSTQVDGANFEQWFANGVRAIPGYDVKDARVALDIDVLKVYVHAVGTMKSVNILVNARWAGGQSGGGQKIYRAVDSSINWNNTESEIQDAFDRALTNLQQQMGADLQTFCRSI